MHSIIVTGTSFLGPMMTRAASDVEMMRQKNTSSPSGRMSFLMIKQMGSDSAV